MCESSKLLHGVLVGVELVERLRFISLTRKEFKESRLSEDNFLLATRWVLRMEEVTNLMGSHDGGEDGVLGPTQQQLLRPDKPKEAATCIRDY